MKKPITVCTGGLGHPEGPYELDDGRVIYANTYASAIGVWDPKTAGQAPTPTSAADQTPACSEATAASIPPRPLMSALGPHLSNVRRRSRRPAPPVKSRSWSPKPMA